MATRRQTRPTQTWRAGLRRSALALALLCGIPATPARAQPAATPPIYVADFELDSAAAPARAVVDAIGNALVRDLTIAGLVARRIAADEALPRRGWLVRGVFVEVDGAHRFRRLVPGASLERFGPSRSDIQVVAVIDDLTYGMPKPFDDRARGSFRFDPYAIAVRFVPPGDDVVAGIRAPVRAISREIIERARL